MSKWMSIYEKMVQKGREFDDIYDLMAIRIVVENVRTSGWTSGPPVAALATNVERDTRSFRAYRFQLTGAASATTALTVAAISSSPTALGM